MLLLAKGFDSPRVQSIGGLVTFDLKQIDDVVFSLNHHVYLGTEDPFLIVFFGPIVLPVMEG